MIHAYPPFRLLRAAAVAVLLLTAAATAQAQTGIGTATPNAAAALDITATNKGLLVPRMDSAARAAIAAPPDGLLVFQTNGRAGFWFYQGGAWRWLADKTKAGDNLGNHTATQTLNLGSNRLIGTGASITGVGLGVRADGGLNLGQNTVGNNVFVGFQSGQANTDGTANTFIGYRSGVSNSTGYSNTFVGRSSGSIAQSIHNTFLGAYAGTATSLGFANTFMGSSSGLSNTLGNENVFVGFCSGIFTSTGSNNNFSGSESGYDNTLGRSNVFVGYRSGRANTEGKLNVFVGDSAGIINVTGRRNVAIGAYAGPMLSGLVHTVTIGYGSHATQSNSLILGGLGGDTVRVGIGTTAPTAMLHVAGSKARLRVEGLGAPGVNRAMFTDPSGLFFASSISADATNRIGINNVSPYGQLDVGGRIHVSGTLAELSFADRALSNRRFLWYSTGGTARLYTDDYAVGGDVLAVTSTGRVGIGTPEPGAMLDIAGGGDFDGANTPGAVTFEWRNGGYRHFIRTRHTATLTSPSNAIDFFLNNSGSAVGSSAPGTGNVAVLTLAQKNGAPLVGIGTQNPIAPLHISASTTAFATGISRSYFFSTQTALTVDVPSTLVPRNVAAYLTGGQLWVNDFIVASALNTTSDARIKRIIGVSDGAQDLAALQRLRITDYTYIDQVSNTAQPVKKIIAQQVEEVLPSAVSKSRMAIPDVYEAAESVQKAGGQLTVRTPKAHGFKTGDQVRLYTETNHDLNPVVTVVDARTFRFEDAAACNQLFVYGKYVNDFRSVDYDALAMLNVSATQELARRVAELQQLNAQQLRQTEQLQRTNRAQDTRLDQQQAALLTLQAQMARLLGEVPTGTQARK